MSLRCFALLLLAMIPIGGFAQQNIETFYLFEKEQDEMLWSDTTLFYRAIQSTEDLYGRVTDFDLPYVARMRRGVAFNDEQSVVDGLKVGTAYHSILRLMGAEEYRRAGLSSVDGWTGHRGGVRLFRFSDEEALRPYSVAVNYTDRNYRLRARVKAERQFAKGWMLHSAMDARTGRDAHVKGVFTNSLTAGLRLSKEFDERHRLAVLLVLPPSVRGEQMAATEEAFSLTGDDYYNPSWGYLAGKVRNARVRREFVPLFGADYLQTITPNTSLRVTAGGRAGIRKRSALGWYDARSPLPDDYRNMPSYTMDAANERAWREGDSKITQVDWDELILENKRGSGHSIYTLEDRVERITDLQARVGFETEVDPRLRLYYGGEIAWQRTRAYKQMRDLLGGDYIIDIDQYLVGDDTFGNRLENDLRHPHREIREGDRFGYDYALDQRVAMANFRAEYRASRFRGDVSAEVGDAVVGREGFFEKELYPGNGSFGRSRRVHFTPYTFKILGGYSFSAKNYLEVVVMASARAPLSRHIFVQPLYNNRVVDRPVEEKTFAAEVNWRYWGERVEVQATGYVTLSKDGRQSMSYYDDTERVYSNMTISQIDRLAWGVEAAVAWSVTPRWQILGAASLGQLTYSNDQCVNILTDVDNRVVEQDARSYMKAYHQGGVPHITACGEVSYWSRKSWNVKASVGYAGQRYIDPVALRRTDRVVNHGDNTASGREALVAQERLKDAFRLDVSVSKTFYLGDARLTAFVQLRNLTNQHDIYGGYESLRMQRTRVATAEYLMPQPTRYTHVCPRSIYCMISYRF